jgi:hypothetical protein
MDVLPPPNRFARSGSLPKVANMGSLLRVLLATVKPVWAGSEAAG